MTSMTDPIDKSTMYLRLPTELKRHVQSEADTERRSLTGMAEILIAEALTARDMKRADAAEGPRHSGRRHGR